MLCRWGVPNAACCANWIACITCCADAMQMYCVNSKVLIYRQRWHYKIRLIKGKITCNWKSNVGRCVLTKYIQIIKASRCNSSIKVSTISRKLVTDVQELHKILTWENKQGSIMLFNLYSFSYRLFLGNVFYNHISTPSM